MRVPVALGPPMLVITVAAGLAVPVTVVHFRILRSGVLSARDGPYFCTSGLGGLWLDAGRTWLSVQVQAAKPMKPCRAQSRMGGYVTAAWNAVKHLVECLLAASGPCASPTFATHPLIYRNSAAPRF
jgi:hypothetical protein